MSAAFLFVLGHLEPITLYDHGGVHVSLHFAKDSPPGRPGVAVVVISTVNTSALDVKDFVFQAAVPKVINNSDLSQTYHSGTASVNGNGTMTKSTLSTRVACKLEA